MKHETKKAFNEMRDAFKAIDALCHFGELNANEPMYCYDSKAIDALAEAYENEKKAKVTYHTLFFQEQGWKQEKMTNGLKGRVYNKRGWSLWKRTTGVKFG